MSAPTAARGATHTLSIDERTAAALDGVSTLSETLFDGVRGRVSSERLIEAPAEAGELLHFLLTLTARPRAAGDDVLIETLDAWLDGDLQES